MVGILYLGGFGVSAQGFGSKVSAYLKLDVRPVLGSIMQSSSWKFNYTVQSSRVKAGLPGLRIVKPLSFEQQL